MNNKELQKIIDTKNGTISVLKDTVKKWVHEYNMLDACIELEQGKIAELKAENEIILDRLTQYEEDADVQVCLFSDVKRLEQENARLKEENEKLNKMTGIFSVRLCEKYHKTLQKIKIIAQNISEVEFAETSALPALQIILDLITEAEEE